MMRRTSEQSVRALAACALAGLLVACAQAPKPLYAWDAYQPTVYAYLKGEDADYTVQAQTLERDVELARASHAALPPGFHAHLGLLYLKLGMGAKAVEQWQAEKLAFPEGAPFMDFLLRNTAVNTASAPPAVPSGQTTHPQEQE